MTFTVSLSNPSAQTVTVNYGTADGTATVADNDYLATSGVLTFAPGETAKTIAVQVVGDTKFENNETFSVNLSGPANATLGTATGTGTIQNDDAQSVVSIGNVSLAEGNAGTSNATFIVSLSNPSGLTVTVNYATADGTATVADNDYAAVSGTLTFAPGETSKTIAVTVNGDVKFEADETFTVNLSSPTNAAIGAGTGIGTIRNDDTVPSVSINDVSVPEGNSGTASAVFTVTLSNPSSQTVTVNYATADGTATAAGNDYLPAAGTLTFSPGETSRTVTVSIAGDTTNEADETFRVDLSAPANAVIGDGEGIGTIANDDPLPAVSIDNVSIVEGDAGANNAVFAVTLSAPSGQTVVVNFATANGTATAGSDYTATSGTLVFAPGETSKAVSVAVLGDLFNESDETFTVNLSGATNAIIGTGAGTGTIVNNDHVPPVLAGVPAPVTAEAAGPAGAVVTYALPTATGSTGEPLPVVCVPASGSTFPLGSSSVVCTAADAFGNQGSATFTVKVQDTTKPVLTLPANITVDATSPLGAVVTYAVSASDIVSGSVAVICSKASGTTFPIGTTVVNCTATDGSGNAATGSFSVLVQAAAAQVSNLLAEVQAFNLAQGITNSLDAKLTNILSALNAAQSGNVSNVCGQLGAFINQVAAQSGKALTTAQAAQLTADAQRIQTVVGCN